MGRKKKTFQRPVGKLDSSLIVIATEGRVTEKNYFESLKESFLNSKVHVEILPNIDNNSDPQSRFKLLDGFYKEYELDDEDDMFLVVDRDKWTEENLSGVAKRCHQKGMKLCVSNPCFELWLLLHDKDVSKYSEKEKDLLAVNKKVGKTKRYLDKKLEICWGGYNKARVDFSFLIAKVNFAIENAKKLDLHPRQRWPNYLGTRVYLIAEKIIDLAK